MSGFRAWHLALAPVPVLGWLLVAAYLLDEKDERRGSSLPPTPSPIEAPSLRERVGGKTIRIRRAIAAALDLALALLLASALPGGIGWPLGAAFLLFRDSFVRGAGPGKRLLGLAVRGRAGFVAGFERNLAIVLLPLAPLEAMLVARGAARLGDRLARTHVGRAG